MAIIEQIKAEIERRKMESIGFRNNEKREDWASFFNGEATALENLLSFISTLESEKPTIPNDLEKEIDFQTFSKEMGAVFALPKERTENTEEEPLRWEYEIARHFAKWGAEHATHAETPSRFRFIQKPAEWSEKCPHYSEGYGCEISPMKKCESFEKRPH